MKYETIKEATEAWVREFNAFPQGMIEQLWMDHPDEWAEITYKGDEDEDDYYDALPMWGTMWQFGDRIDDDWLSGEFGEHGLKLMSECGFRIYEHEEFGYFFGIDGAGYDFYEAHWIPLYKARGLHWHKEEAA